MRRIGSNNREAERRLMDALQTQLSVRMQRAMQRSLSADYRGAAQSIERMEPVRIDRNATGRIVIAGWEAAAQTFGSRMIDQIGKRHDGIQHKARLTEFFRAAFLSYTREWLATKVTQITQATEDQIRRIVTRGQQEGLSVENIAKEIRNEALPMSRLRSHVIARTETHHASGWANQTAAQESGLDMRKEWCSGSDARVRDAHMDADGQVVALNLSFDVGGEPLDYPGDPSGSAENVINCFLPDTSIAGIGFEVGIRSHYVGDVVEVSVAGEVRFTVTADHKILTDRGWVKAHALNEGDRLIDCRVRDDVASFGASPQVNDAISTAEEMYEAMQRLNGAARPADVVMDLDGHISRKQVDVVSVSRSLSYGLNAARFQFLRNISLEDSDVLTGALTTCRAFALCNDGSSALSNRAVRRRDARFTIFRGKECGAAPVAFRYIRSRISYVFKTCIDRAASYIKMLRDAVNWPSVVHKTLDNRQIFSPSLFISSVNGLGARDACLTNPFTNDLIPNIQTVRDLTARKTVMRELKNVKISRVSGVRTVHYDGPVYDFQTENGIVVAGDIITHNCRCASLFIEV